MADNPLDINYGTQAQVEYARAMAKYLREKKGFQMTPGMAVLPGSWAHGLGDVVDAISQGRYQDIAGQQDRTLRARGQVPGYTAPSAPSTVGGELFNYLKSKTKDWFEGSNKSIIAPGTESKDITTGSLPPVDTPVEPKEETNYADLVKQRENPALYSGKLKTSQAQWDFKQHTNGFGTRAINEKEVIGVDEAHQRFDSEWKRAQDEVDKFKPGLPQGPRAALTSLTFNSGQKWMKDGLGAAVQANDPVKSKELFLQYNKATDAKTGQTTTLAGIKERRNQEVQWFDDVTPNAPKTKLPGMMNLGGDPQADREGKIQGDRVAQDFSSQPAPNKAAVPSVQNTGGYTGQLPPVGPVRTDEQLMAQRMGASTPEDAQKILEQHMKDLKGDNYKTPTGELNARMGPDGKPMYTHIPNQMPPISIGGMNLHMIPDGKGGFKLITPNGEDASLEKLNKQAADLEAVRTRVTGRASIKTEEYAKKEDEINKRAQAASVNTQMLGVAKQMSNDPNFYSGTGAERILDYKKIASYLSGNPNWSGSTEAFGKLLARSNIEGLEAFKGYGQIRNPEIELLRESSGQLSNTPGAIQAIIDMNARASERLTEIGQLMRDYRKDKGTLDEGFDDVLAKFYKDKPLYSDDDIKNYKDLFKMEKNKGNNPWIDLGQGARRMKIE